MNQEQEQQYQPRELSFASMVKLTTVLLIAGIVALLVLLALPTLEAFSPLLGIVLILTLAVSIPGAVAFGVWYLWDIRQEKRLRSHLVVPNAHNSYAAMWIEEEKRFVQPINGELPQQVPSHYSPSIQNNNDPRSIYKIMEMARQGQTPLEIEAPDSEQIGAVVHYRDVVDEVPDGMSLLGIHPANGSLELSNWENLKMLWIIGSSSTGKSNTVYGMALQARNNDAKIMVVDQHSVKPDSLARKLEPLKAAFLRPVAVSDTEVLSTIQAWKAEFERRVHCPVCAQSDVPCAECSQKIVLIMDEMNRMARNETLLAAIKEIVAIGGEESRGFGMYVWCLSQKAVHLKWLRDSAITVIAHRLTSFAEALLACNEDRKAANKLLKFPVGRVYVYGVDFDDLLELQQPLYEVNPQFVVESDIAPSEIPETPPSDGRPNLRLVADEPEQWEAACEGGTKGNEGAKGRSDLSEQEKRIGEMFLLEHVGISAIVRELWPDIKGGDAYQRKTAEVSDAIRKCVESIGA